MAKKYNSCLIWVALSFAVFIYISLFTALSVLQYRSFFFFSSDSLAVANNILWHTASGRIFYNSIWDRLLNFHASFFYIFIAPIYKLCPNILTLFVLVHSAIAIGVLPVFWIAREKFKSEFIALLFGFSYLLFNPLHHLSFVANKPLVSFSTTFFLFLLYFFYKRQLTKFIIFGLLAMMCRDEVGFIIFMFAFIALRRRMSLRWKLVPVLLGGGYLLIVWQIIMPYIGYPPYYSRYIWELLGDNPQKMSFLQLFFLKLKQKYFIDKFFSLSHFGLLVRLFDPPIFLVSLFAPGVFLLGLPVIISVQMSVERYFLALESVHHMAFLIPLIFIGAIFGMEKIIIYFYNKGIFPQWLSQQKLFFVGGCIFLASTLLSNLGNNILFPPGGLYREDEIADKRFISEKNMFSRLFYTQDEKDKMAWEFIRLIPSSASVSVSETYLPALSSRAKIFHFGCTKEINDRDGHDFDTDYVFLNKKEDYNGFGGIEVSRDKMMQRLSILLNDNRYTVVKENDAFILLKKGS